MPYTIEYSSLASKQMEKLNKTDQIRVLNAIEKLTENPHPRGSRKLSGADDSFRIRIGHLRAVYTISRIDSVVIISRVGQRKDVYRNL